MHEEAENLARKSKEQKNSIPSGPPKHLFNCLKHNHPKAAIDMTNQALSNPSNRDPLLKVVEAAKLLSISVPSFWRRVADGSVPKPIKLGSSSRWPHSEIIAVIEEAKARR